MASMIPAVRLVCAAALVLALCGFVQAVEKDVPYVPTPTEVVAEMLKQAQVKRGDLVYDLGCGDGRIIVTAAKEHGARGVGVDIDPQRIAESNANAKEAGVTDKVKFITGNLFALDFKDADVVTLYLLSEINTRLRPKLLSELRPGARVVSHAFAMGDWDPENHVVVEPDGQNVYLWIIPAKVQGTWSGAVKGSEGEQKAELDLRQRYQVVTGAATINGQAHKITDGKLRGKELTFTAGDAKYTATVEGDQLRGENITARRKQAK